MSSILLGLVWGDIYGNLVDSWAPWKIQEHYGQYATLPVTLDVERLRGSGHKVVRRIRQVGVHSGLVVPALALVQLLSKGPWDRTVWGNTLATLKDSDALSDVSQHLGRALKNLSRRVPPTRSGLPSLTLEAAVRCVVAGGTTMPPTDLRTLCFENTATTHASLAAAAFSYAVALAARMLLAGTPWPQLYTSLIEEVLAAEDAWLADSGDWNVDRTQPHLVSQTLRLLTAWLPGGTLAGLSPNICTNARQMMPQWRRCTASKAHLLLSGMQALGLSLLPNVPPPGEALRWLVVQGGDTTASAALAAALLAARYDLPRIQHYAAAVSGGEVEGLEELLAKEAEWTKEARVLQRVSHVVEERCAGSGEGEAEGEPGAKDKGRPDYEAEIQSGEAEFRLFYAAQSIASEAQWPLLLATLRRELPTTFRVTDGERAPLIRRVLERLRALSRSAQLQPLAWYPGELAWYLRASKKDLKDPGLADLRCLLISENVQGGITRQEAVSMLPPLFLAVEPNDAVLDMCASPGSKTSQIVDFLAPLGGLVVANDANVKRCYMLAHQTQRLGRPNVLISNHEAQKFPALPFPFDRILCDVPCSGDGTMRKSTLQWKAWHIRFALKFHPLQVEIAARAVELLKVGGRLVYSTCSFSPIENEAVVAEILRQCNGAVDLLDMSASLPGVLRQPGLATWRVFNIPTRQTAHGSGGLDQYEVHEGGVDPEQAARFPRSVFPPSEAEAQAFQLHRCMRLLPQEQDTGGFFIAVLQKKSPHGTVNRPMAFEPLAEIPLIAATEETLASLAAVLGEHGIEAGQLDPRAAFLQRETNDGGQILMTTTRLHELVTTSAQTGLRAIVGGVAVMKKHNNGRRITQEGLQLLGPLVSRRLVPASAADLDLLLGASEPVFWDRFGLEFQAQLSGIPVEACFVVRVSDGHPLAGRLFPAWKGQLSCTLFVSKEDRQALQLLIELALPSS